MAEAMRPVIPPDSLSFLVTALAVVPALASLAANCLEKICAFAIAAAACLEYSSAFNVPAAICFCASFWISAAFVVSWSDRTVSLAAVFAELSNRTLMLRGAVSQTLAGHRNKWRHVFAPSDMGSDITGVDWVGTGTASVDGARGLLMR